MGFLEIMLTQESNERRIGLRHKKCCMELYVLSIELFSTINGRNISISPTEKHSFIQPAVLDSTLHMRYC